MTTQTDIAYQGTASGLTVYVTVVKIDDLSVAFARDTTDVVEMVASSGLYRARRDLDPGKYVALFDEGTFAPPSITAVPVSV